MKDPDTSTPKPYQENIFESIGVKEPQAIFELSSALDYIAIARKGLPGEAIKKFIKSSGLSQKQAARAIHVSERTLQRYQPDDLLDSQASERLLRLARLYAKGENVFNDLPKFTRWMDRENISLGNQKPADLLDTLMGCELVMDELTRIEYGIFA